MVFTARKNVSTVEVKLKGIGSQSYGIIRRDFVCCWGIRPGYKVYKMLFLKKPCFFCFNFFNTPFFKCLIRLLIIVMWMTSWSFRKLNFFLLFLLFLRHPVSKYDNSNSTIGLNFSRAFHIYIEQPCS